MQTVPLRHSLAFRVGLMAAALFVSALVLTLSGLDMLKTVEEHHRWSRLMGRGSAFAYQVGFLGERLPYSSLAARPAIIAEARQVIADMDERYELLLNGDEARGIPRSPDARLTDAVRANRDMFDKTLRPALLELIEAQRPEDVELDRVAFRANMRAFAAATEATVDDAQERASDRIRSLRAAQLGFAVLLGAVLLGVGWAIRDVLRRLRKVSDAATRIAAGDLTHSAAVEGQDELAALGRAFDGMTAALRQKIDRLETVLQAVRGTVNDLASATAEIAAATQQQASSSQEQASAVYETLTAADEVARAADQAAARAKEVAESAEDSDRSGAEGRRSIEDAVGVLGRAKTHSDAIASGILSLAERSQAVAEVVGAINDIAEQTNILSINAAIEASRAGEQGKGFQVVAAEVRQLAEQSKKATVHARQILGEIQRLADRAVLATEDGTRSMAAAVESLGRAGTTLTTLLDAITSWTDTAGQIAQGAAQQAQGLSQISHAVKNISDAANQNLASTRQTDEAARNLELLGSRLKQLVEAGA